MRERKNEQRRSSSGSSSGIVASPSGLRPLLARPWKYLVGTLGITGCGVLAPTDDIALQSHEGRSEQIGGDMSEHAALSGELVYQYAPRVTQIVEFGASADAVFSGRTPPPREGARFDLYLEGPVNGPKLAGTLRGVDYLNFRADGRAELHIHAEITTEDGPKIALLATGLAIPEEGSSVFQLRENVTLMTNYPHYNWVNQIQLWAAGTVDFAKGEVDLKAYAA